MKLLLNSLNAVLISICICYDLYSQSELNVEIMATKASENYYQQQSQSQDYSTNIAGFGFGANMSFPIQNRLGWLLGLEYVYEEVMRYGQIGGNSGIVLGDPVPFTVKNRVSYAQLKTGVVYHNKSLRNNQAYRMKMTFGPVLSVPVFSTQVYTDTYRSIVSPRYSSWTDGLYYGFFFQPYWRAISVGRNTWVTTHGQISVQTHSLDLDNSFLRFYVGLGFSHTFHQ